MPVSRLSQWEAVAWIAEWTAFLISQERCPILPFLFVEDWQRTETSLKVNRYNVRYTVHLVPEKLIASSIEDVECSLYFPSTVEFEEKAVSYQEFANNPSIIDDPDLVVKIGVKYVEYFLNNK